jgi:hypothetical protein
MKAATQLQHQLAAARLSTQQPTAAPGSTQAQQQLEPSLSIEELHQQWAAMDASVLSTLSSSLGRLLGVTDPDLLQQLLATLEGSPGEVMAAVQHWSQEVAFMDWGVPALQDMWGGLVLLLVAAAGAGAAAREQLSPEVMVGTSSSSRWQDPPVPGQEDQPAAATAAAAVFSRQWGSLEQVQQLPLDFSSKYGTQVLVLAALGQLVEQVQAAGTPAVVEVAGAGAEGATAPPPAAATTAAAPASDAAPTAAAAQAVTAWLQGTLQQWVMEPIAAEVQHHLGQLMQHLAGLELEGRAVLQRASSSRKSRLGPPTAITASAAATPSGGTSQQHQEGPAAALPSAAAAARPGATTSSSSSAEAGRHDLVAFADFDPDLPGADMLLEELGSSLEGSSPTSAAVFGRLGGSQEGLEGGSATQHTSSSSSSTSSSSGSQEEEEDGEGGMGRLLGDFDLVAFTDFDPDLAGAGELLEEALEEEGEVDVDPSAEAATAAAAEGGGGGQDSGGAEAGSSADGRPTDTQEASGFDFMLEDEEGPFTGSGVNQKAAGMSRAQQQLQPDGLGLPSRSNSSSRLVAGMHKVASFSSRASTPPVAAVGAGNITSKELQGLVWALVKDQGAASHHTSHQQLLAAAAEAGRVLQQQWLRHAAALEWRQEQELAAAAAAGAESAGSGSSSSGSRCSLQVQAAVLLQAGVVALTPLAAAAGGLESLHLTTSANTTTSSSSSSSAPAPLAVGDAYQLYGQLAASVTPGVPLPGRQQLLGSWTAAVQQLTANQAELLSWQEGCATLMQQLHQQLTSASADTEGPLRVSGLVVCSSWRNDCLSVLWVKASTVCQLASIMQRTTVDDPQMCWRCYVLVMTDLLIAASPARQAMQGLLRRRQAWLDAAAGVAEEVGRLAEAAVQLEYSRAGKLWGEWQRGRREVGRQGAWR